MGLCREVNVLRWGKGCSQYTGPARFLQCCYQRTEWKGVFKCAKQVLCASERYRIPGNAVLKSIDSGVDVKTFSILTDTAAHKSTTSCHQLHYLLTYFTSWCRVLLEKPTCSQLLKKFPAFYRTRRFIPAFTSARYLSLSWANSIQSIRPHPTSWRSILILSSHLRLGLPSCNQVYHYLYLLTYSMKQSPSWEANRFCS